MVKIEKKAVFETAKFVVRLALLVFLPQLVAWAVDNTGVFWADILSVTLPIVDKWVHESDFKANGLVPF